jgi:hypothetical protein
MKFYYRYVIGLKEPDKISEEIDPAMFGNVLHEVMRVLYKDHLGKTISPEIIDRLIKDKVLQEKVIDNAIREKFRNGEEGLINGNELIVRDILQSFLRRILYTDKKIAPVTILRLEEYYDFKLDIPYDGRTARVRTGGIADRIDMTGGVTRIVDYKTGTVADSLCSPDDLFQEDRKKDIDGWLQILLYCEAFLAREPVMFLRPSIYKIKKMAGNGTSDRLIMKQGREEVPVDDYMPVREEFISGLKESVARIFRQDEPFTMTKDPLQKCRYCSYRILCSR